MIGCVCGGKTGGTGSSSSSTGSIDFNIYDVIASITGGASIIGQRIGKTRVRHDEQQDLDEDLKLLRHRNSLQISFQANL